MEFGKLTVQELEKADLKLPQEPARNSTILKGTAVAEKKVYVGCSKWGRPEWVGRLYQLKTKEKDYLQHYVQYYNCVELNATHYKVYGEAHMAEWRKKAEGYDFKFCPKMYKGITHAGNLNAKPFIINEFLRGIRGFGDKLGPAFIQLHERFSPNRMEELIKFLEALPADIRFFLELRHEKWFTQKSLEQLLPCLESKKIGFIITDTAGRRDCCHMYLSVPSTFIRFVGNSLHPTDLSRVDEWAKRIKQWLEKGMNEVYFMVHSGDEAVSPELTKYVVDTFNNVCGLSLPVITLRPGSGNNQNRLFD
jgi:uncharacterized protein YecE (DUF72 family)